MKNNQYKWYSDPKCFTIHVLFVFILYFASNSVALIRTKELSVYHFTEKMGKQMIIDRANIAINQGRVVAISGQSGSGKTMLAFALSGMSRFLPGIFLDGNIAWNDVDLAAISSGEYRRKFSPQIAFIWQQPQASFHPLLTVQKQWMLSLQDDNKSFEQASSLFKNNLLRLGLIDVEKVLASLPSELSTGQLQRVNVAMAISRQPKLIISDEATASLDTDIATLVLETIASFQKQTNIPWILITHNQQQIEHYADEVYRIDISGRVYLIDKKHLTKNISIDSSEAIPSSLKHHKIDSGALPLLQTSSISYRYPSQSWFKRRNAKLKILNEINIKIHENVFYGLSGPSGSGKSTLAKLLSGDLTTDSGSMFWKGKLIQNRKYAINEDSHYKIQLIFQDALLSLDPSLAVIEQLNEVVNHAASQQIRDERGLLLEELIHICGLKKDELHKFPRQYSGGQLQRIVFIRALLALPEFIIFDETFSALDEEVKSDLVNLLFQLYNRKPFSALIISHDIQLLNRLCTQTFLLNNGEIVQLDNKLS